MDAGSTELPPITVEECLECATLVRGVKPLLRADSTRDVAEAVALRFEAEAAALRTDSPV